MSYLDKVLEGLGGALYKHAKESVEADEALESVEYLEDKDVLPKDLEGQVEDEVSVAKEQSKKNQGHTGRLYQARGGTMYDVDPELTRRMIAEKLQYIRALQGANRGFY